MKYFYIVLILSCSLYGKDFQEQRLDWFNKNQINLIQTIRSAKSTDLIPVMEMLGQLWLRRDGALGVEVAPFIAEILIKSPEIGFVWFIDHPKAFESYILRSQQTLFTDYRLEATTQIEMEYLRQRLALKSMEFSRNTDSKELAAMSKKLYEHIHRLKVRVID